MKVRAASWAAAKRFGLTSTARMLPETSSARITVSFCDGRVTLETGRAAATSIAVTASRNSAGGTWRRTPAQRPCACFTSARPLYLSANFLRRLTNRT